MNRSLGRELVACAALGLSGAALASIMSARGELPAVKRPQPRAIIRRLRPARAGATVTAARQLNRAAGTLAFSVLADSSVEHYRGSFKNKAMFTPLIVSALTLGMSLHGTADKRPLTHGVRDTTYLLAAVTGLLGSGFHLYNVGKRTGGFSWQNLFYGAPLGAPIAILLAGLIGFCSERVREGRFTPEQVAAVRAEGQRVAAELDAGRRWWDPAWATWSKSAMTCASGITATTRGSRRRKSGGLFRIGPCGLTPARTVKRSSRLRSGLTGSCRGSGKSAPTSRCFPTGIFSACWRFVGSGWIRTPENISCSAPAPCPS